MHKFSQIKYELLKEYPHLIWVPEWIIMQKIVIADKIFEIRLASDEIWQLISTFEAREWLDKLCTIMGLDEFSELEGHKIIFFKNVSDKSNITKFLNLNKVHLLNTGPLRLYKCQNASHFICEISNTYSPEVELLKMAQSILPLYMSVLHQGGLPLHGALLERNGIGIAIAAPGGTGKSTCASRIPKPWQALCDDEQLIVRDKKGIYHAHPFPTWSRCNQEPMEIWNVQTHVPISAIFFLKKSKKDEVNLLSSSLSAVLIYKLSLPVFNRILGSIDESESTLIKKLIFENACDIAKDIPSFILEASLEGKFWEVIERAQIVKGEQF